MPDDNTAATRPCPDCTADVRGRFCPRCGTLAREAPCAACGVTLSPGDRFCGECGAAVGATGGVPIAKEDWRPSTGWKVGVGALAAVLVVALVMRFGAERPQQPATAFSSAGSMQGQPGSVASAGVLSMTPQQQADALFDRVMRLSAEGKVDSVQFFAPMALAVYQGIASPSADQRYDLGRIGEITGNYGLAKAQADTILAANPSHLLALALRARMSADPQERAGYQRRLLAAAPAERAKALPEYAAHAAELERAIAEAQKGGR